MMVKSRWMFKLKYKVAIHILLASLPCVAAVGIFSYTTAKHHVHEMIEFEYFGSLNRVKEIIRGSIEQVKQDARFLSRTPAARQFVMERPDSTESQDRRNRLLELESMFREMVAGKPCYARICLLDCENRELIRVEREGDMINSAAWTGPGDGFPRIQPVQMHPAKDWGEVAIETAEAGSNPLLRFVSPVSSEGVDASAFLVMDVAAQDFLDVKKMFTVFQLKDVGNVFVADRNGAYLHHCVKNVSENHARDEGPGDRNLAEDYPGTASGMLAGKDGTDLLGDRRIFYSTLPLSDHFALIIGLDTPRGPIEAPIHQFRLFLLYVVAATLFMTWLFSALFARLLLGAIKVLHDATRRISAGDFRTTVEIRGNDEIRDLAEGFNTMTGALQKKTREIKQASQETIYRLLKAAETRDEDTGMHLQRMSRYAEAVGRRMGLDPKTTEAILYAAPMHDVGKIAVPDRILLKPGKLDAEEWETMKRHTVRGGDMLEGSSNGFLKLAEEIARTHHERWDGTGYPRGLKGTEIPLVGRITAIADVFDALTSRRPYKEPFPLGKALAIIREGRGTHFDPEVVDAFFAIQDEIVAIMEKYRD